MALFNRVADYVWSYFNPRKTQQQRTRPYKAATIKSQKVLHAAAQARKRRAQRARRMSAATSKTEDDSYDDSMLEREASTESESLVQRELSSLDLSNEEIYDANESTLVMTERDYANEQLENKEVFDHEAHLKRLKDLRAELQQRGWAGDAIGLFIKLESRGKEPLLPKSWELEFETLPIGLFTPEGYEPHIGSISTTGDFRASLALKELIKLAPRVRDANVTRRSSGATPNQKGVISPEVITKKAVGEYLKWAYADANLRVATPNSRKSLDDVLMGGGCLPLLVNVAGPRTMSGAELQATTIDRLVKLGEQWKAALANPDGDGYVTDLPTLYGVISTYTIFGFVAYDIDFIDGRGEPESPFLRTVAIFDFSQRGYDVWNSLAIALFGIHVRNEMLDIKKDIKSTKGPEYGLFAEPEEHE